MPRGALFVVSLGLMMARTIVLGWVMDGTVPGGSSVTRTLISCPKYSVGLNTGLLLGTCSYMSLSSEYCRNTVE